MRLLWIILIFLCSCAATSSSGYTSLTQDKKKIFVPFNPETLNDSIDFNSENFTVQEITADQVKILADKFNYTWVVIWAPWCPGPETEEYAANYIKYEQQLANKGIKLIFVALGYGPEGIRKMAKKLNYHNLTFVIADQPGVDNLKSFHQNLNKSRKYRNANIYIFQKGKGLIYTEKDPIIQFDKLNSLLN